MITLSRPGRDPAMRVVARALVCAIAAASLPMPSEGYSRPREALNPIEDDLYRLTAEDVSGGPIVYSKTFDYDDVGNRLTQTTVGSGAPGTPTAPGTIDYLYDTRDRIDTVDGQPYAWDANGNLTAKPDGSTYTWDFENRLTQVTLADGTTVEHLYDVDGNRVQTTTTPAGGSAEVTNYLVDTSGSLSHVVVESDAADNLIAQYVRGDDLLAVIRPTQTRFFHADGLGSIRRLTDENGMLQDGYTYSAFGELIGHSGTDTQPYAFTGEPLDLNSGFQYHRARWMDPSVGRFSSSDTWPATQVEPGSLHRYLYAEANPTNRVDPTGYFSFGFGVTVAVVAVLAAASYVTWLPNSQGLFGGARIVVADFRWDNDFTILTDDGIDALSLAETEQVKLWALQTLRLAYSGYRIQVAEGGGTNHLFVKNRSELDPRHCGDTLFNQVASDISYGCAQNIAYQFREYVSGDRSQIVAGIGRTIGFVAAHELGHQLRLPQMDQNRNPEYYDYYAADTPSTPYGSKQGWNALNRRRLDSDYSY